MPNLGTLTRQQLSFMSLERKAKVTDADFRDEIKTKDRRMTAYIDVPPLDGVSEGRHEKYDIRERPDIAGFPKGDKRRW